jgi:hypothetical protein
MHRPFADACGNSSTLARMHPPQPTFDMTATGITVKIEHSLARMAHPLEVVAKHADPAFKPLAEALAEQKKAQRGISIVKFR